MRLIHYKKSVPNFGDDLNVDLWPVLAPRIFADPEDGHGFLGIGTIVGMHNPMQRIEIFSSGAGYNSMSNWDGKEVSVRCIRGPLTAKLLGVDPALALTDGAILTPLSPSFPNRAGPFRGLSGGTIVIPHFETIAYPGWAEACRLAGFELVDPRGTPVDVIGRIASAELVVTESLHGAIIADVYGIPWTAFCTSRNFGSSKWVDWLATLGMDFESALVPPPNAAQLLHFGKRAEPFGERLRLTLAEAMRDYQDRMCKDVRNPIKEVVKKTVLRVPPLQRLFGYSPERTAEALQKLVAGPLSLSAEARRNDLRDRMLDLLLAMEREIAG